MRPALPSLILLLAAGGLGGCTLAGDHYIGRGDTKAHNLRTLAGDINIDRDASVQGARAIAGDITVGANATTGDLTSTAGDIDIASGVTVNGDIKSTAGDITLGPNSHVTGSVITKAGDIELIGCRVDGAVRMTAGRLRTRDTQLPGGLEVPYSRWMSPDRPNRLEIGPGSIVAFIKVDPRAEVELRVSREAEVGTITGAEPEYY